MKIGDNVSFLNSQGGGRIAGFQGKNIVLVEDEDGFQIPTLITDVVVVSQAEEYQKNMFADKNAPEKADEEEEDYDPADREVTFRMPQIDREGGEELTCYLAFVPRDIRELSRTKYDCFIINDCNYQMFVAYSSVDNDVCTLRYAGVIDSNTKFLVESLHPGDLNQLGKLRVQLIAYKEDKFYTPRPTIDVELRVNAVKLSKVHTFDENDFFEEKALLMPIVENDVPAQENAVDAKKLEDSMKAKINEPTKPKEAPKRRKGDEEVMVIDLHADELLDTTQGMSPRDILDYQLTKFNAVMLANRNKRGQQIIFIHGKGEGVLRQAVINELRYKYKGCQYQDASFQEYGFGATKVTIR